MPTWSRRQLRHARETMSMLTHQMHVEPIRHAAVRARVAPYPHARLFDRDREMPGAAHIVEHDVAGGAHRLRVVLFTINRQQ